MMRILKLVSQFLRESIWLERKGTRGAVRFLISLLRVSSLVAKGFLDNKCFLRASALAYTTLLSIVPLLAFVFAILKGLGVEEQVRPHILARLAAAQEPVAQRLVEYVSNYISNTSVAALGAFGLITLLYTVVKVLSTVESSFNEIWGISQGRTWLRKIADYTSVMVIAPVLLVTAIGVSTYLLAHPVLGMGSTFMPGRFLAGILARTGPVIMTWMAFTAFYAFMPNTQVRLVSALSGGLVGGTLWQLAFWGYTRFQVGVAQYNAVYTSFAALPVFLVWLYICWVIALFGAEVAFATQNVEMYRREQQRFAPSPRTRERLGLRVFLEIARAFHKGQPAMGTDDISRESGVPIRAVRETIATLTQAGLVSEAKGRRGPAYLPARDLSQVSPASVISAIRDQGDDMDISEKDPLWQQAAKAADCFCGALGKGDLAKDMVTILEAGG